MGHVQLIYQLGSRGKELKGQYKALHLCVTIHQILGPVAGESSWRSRAEYFHEIATAVILVIQIDKVEVVQPIALYCVKKVIKRDPLLEVDPTGSHRAMRLVRVPNRFHEQLSRFVARATFCSIARNLSIRLHVDTHTTVTIIGRREVELDDGMILRLILKFDRGIIATHSQKLNICTVNNHITKVLGYRAPPSIGKVVPFVTEVQHRFVVLPTHLGRLFGRLLGGFVGLT